MTGRDPSVIALVLTALALALALACTPPEQRAEQAREAIRRALEQGNRAAALAAVDELRDDLPDTPEALLEVGGLLVRSGDAPRAGWLLEDAVRRFPDRDDLRLALAHVSLLLGNPSRAREVVLAIPAESAQHGGALVTRAQAELALGDAEQALATLSEAERLHPDEPGAWLVRIQTLLSERRFDEARSAIEAARAAVAGEDESSVALRHRLDVALAQLQAQQGDASTGLATLRAMVGSDAADRVAWNALLEMLAIQGRSAEALPLLEKALGGDAPPPDLFLLAAQVQAGLGLDDQALASLRSFAERSESPVAVVPLVEFYSARGDATAALTALDRALVRAPGEPALRLLRVEALLADAEIDEARAELGRFRDATFEGDPQVDYLESRLALAEGDARGAAQRLRELAPKLDSAATQFWLGRALEQSGDLEGALRRYALAQRRNPAWTPPSIALIALTQRRGDWRAVAAQCEGLVKRAPRELGAWVAWVDALEKLGQGQAAESVARQSLARFPERAEPHVLLARALRTQGRTDEALAALDRAAAIQPGPDLAAERAVTLGLGGKVGEGIALARQTLERQPGSAVLEAALASLLFAKGDADAGARATDRALLLAPDEPRPLRVRCEFEAAAGRFAAARDDCTRYLAARPDDPGAHFMLGVALDAVGDHDAAVAAYRRAARLDERDARPRNNLALLLAEQGDLDGALAAAQEAFRIDEKNPYVGDTLGELYRKKGLADRAVSLLEDAHAGLPDVPEVTLHLALAYQDAGRSDEARTLLGELKRSAQLRDALRPRVDEALGSLP